MVSEPAQSPVLDGLNDAQLEAVTAINGPLLVVAGPGSGKTAVLTRRIAHMVAAGGVEARNILAMTFTNKAADEMKERVARLLPVGAGDANRVWIHTFHGFCAKILRIEHAAAGIPSAYTILDSSDSKTVVQAVVRDLRKESFYDTPRKMKELVSSISRLKNGGFVRNSDDFTKIYSEYSLRLKRMGALDFDDLIGRTYELFESDPVVLDKYVRRFTHVLVDEYQDTNPVQYKLLRILTSRNRNVCVVGDMDQSIYGFRMATPEIMQTFLEDFKETKTVNLTINYRSTPNILDVAYGIIEGNESDNRAILSTNNDPGEKVSLVACGDPDAEARFVSEKISRLPASTTVGILMRTNAQSRKLETILPADGIAVQTVGTLRFYDRAEIKDVFSYLRLALNPRDALAFSRAVGVPRRGLGPKAIEEVVSEVRDTDILCTLEGMLNGGLLSGQKAAKWSAFVRDVRDLQECARSCGLVRAIKLVLEQGLEKHTMESDTEQTGKAENLTVLVAAAEEFAQKKPVNEDGTYKSNIEVCEEFLTTCSLSSGEDSIGETGKARTHLMSVHAAKGKEFDVVFVVGCEEGMFPHVKGGGRAGVTGRLNSEYEAEERRLLFVAATRARHKLYLTYAQKRLVGDTLRENIAVSPYLSGVPSSLLTKEYALDTRPYQGGRAAGYKDRVARWGGGPSASVGSRRRGDDSAGRVGSYAVHQPRLSRDTVFVGCLVRHTKFGDGVITKIDGDTEDASVTIKFGGDLRMFKLSATPLEIAK